ncbi:hypothetical protein D9758_009033 [Tetrapyrgos nigripes]|uniref:CFEM domain-containing protein n=1 Tax=Tetrapyrgos nigripes TaxID=182062 RepID=A0A8H5GA32_9AGAR|nr:hypothetical protein D9758_009033 [Tetrapyrgos nigripes]
MLRERIAFVFGLAAAVAVNAQDTSGINQCILNCTSQAASANGCVSFADITCVCTNQAFQTAAAACLQANCTSDDLTNALQLQQQQCAALSSGASGVTSAPQTSAPASSGTVSAPTSAPVPTSTSPTSRTNGSATRTGTSSSSATGPSNTSGAVSGFGISLAMVVGLGGAVVASVIGML